MWTPRNNDGLLYFSLSRQYIYYFQWHEEINIKQEQPTNLKGVDILFDTYIWKEKETQLVPCKWMNVI